MKSRRGLLWIAEASWATTKSVGMWKSQRGVGDQPLSVPSPGVRSPPCHGAAGPDAGQGGAGGYWDRGRVHSARPPVGAASVLVAEDKQPIVLDLVYL